MNEIFRKITLCFLLLVSTTSYGFIVTGGDIVLQRLQHSTVQYIVYGDLHTFVLATDDFFDFDTDKLTKCQLQTLQDIAFIIRQYPYSQVNIAGFTDDVGDPIMRRQLSFFRAQSMLAYLWSQGVELERLNAIGFGEYYDIANNNTVFGSGMNRRVEVQWRSTPPIK